ncbi:MAG: hypothetical protein SNG38_07505 [Rikenellaceae bacterium]
MKRLFLLFAIAISTVACVGTDTSLWDDNSSSDGSYSTATLVVSTVDIPSQVDYAGGGYNIYISSSLGWKVTSSESWVTPSPSYGNSGDDIAVELCFDPFNDEDAGTRIATITVSTTLDMQTTDITVKQSSK